MLAPTQVRYDKLIQMLVQECSLQEEYYQITKLFNMH